MVFFELDKIIKIILRIILVKCEVKQKKRSKVKQKTKKKEQKVINTNLKLFEVEKKDYLFE